MLATKPSESASNWDLTPVFDLLRSPTRSDTFHPAHDAESKSSSKGQHQTRHHTEYNTEYAVDKGAPMLTPRKSHTRLGDFGSLWELLEQDQNSANRAESPGKAPAKPDNSSPGLEVYSSLALQQLRGQNQASTAYDPESPSSPPLISKSNTTKPCVTKDTVAGHSSSSATHLPAITILKRAANTESGRKNAPRSIPQVPELTKEVCDFLGISTAKPKVKSERKPRRSKLGPPQTSGESSGDNETDPVPNVFDQPVSKKSGVLTFVPTQVGRSNARGQWDDTPPSSFEDKRPGVIKNHFNGPGPMQVQSSLHQTARERRVFLMTKLLNDFPDFAQFVSSGAHATNSPTKSVGPCSVHVFVDMSNIMVGFHDSVKVSRNLPITARIRRVHMSFANLSLIMERGRPAAKKVLVGSDRLPSIEEAETLGYETNILDRVHKAKPKSRSHKPRKPGTQWASGKPEMASATEERWVEQGVDEILHLKILESLIDTVEPATIVLATGDGAEAEYSGGFMCQVERVLQRGWNVEIVSFSHVTSNAYRNKGFRSKWASQFRLIELDAYLEELFF